MKFLMVVVVFSLCSVVYAASNPVPLLNQPVVPSAVAPGSAGFTLTVNGSGFIATSVANWNGSARTTHFVSSSQVTADIPSSDVAAAGTASVTVFNPGPGGGTSNVQFVQVIASSSTLNFSKSDTTFSFGSLLGQPVVADFNGDGKLDIAVAESNNSVFPNAVNVLLGNVDGTFQTAVAYPVGDSPYGVASGDFNGDGKLDLAVVNVCGSDSTCASNGTVSILLGNGDGTFQTQTTYLLGIPQGHISVADFNGDGKLDLAITECGGSTCGSNGSVSILLGNGDGTFQPRVDYTTKHRPAGIAVGDFNHDGIVDIAAANTGSDSISVLIGKGDGTFQGQVTYTVQGAPVDIITADFSGDGKLDLATGYTGGSIAVLLGNGDGTFQPYVDYSGACCTSSGLIAGDFNGDGKLDIAVAATNAFSVLPGNADGTFQTALNFAADFTSIELAAGDFNRDGALDLAVTYGTGTFSTFLQTVAAPAVMFSPTGLTFPVALINSIEGPSTATLTNTGTADLHISNITAAGDFTQTNNCPATLPITQSCTISVTYTPKHRGVETGTITVSDDAPGGSQALPLTGTCTVFTLAPTKLSFGAQKRGTTSPPQTVTVTNTDVLPVSVTGVVFRNFNPEDFVQTNHCKLIPGKGTCAITVYFRPTFYGYLASDLTVSSNDGSGNQFAFVSGGGIQ
jgi:FG-GAP-like repeat